MGDPSLIRAVALFLPLSGAWLAAMAARPRPRQWAGALLACAWCIPTLLALHVLAIRLGWWRFEAQGGLFVGIPVDLYIGWVILWGALPAIAVMHVPVLVIIPALLGFDLLLMPLAYPVVELGERWLIGEVLGLAACALPALLLARWTARGIRLRPRVYLIAIAFAGLVFGVLTTIVLELTGGSWRALTDRPSWLIATSLQFLAIPAVVGLAAVLEFAIRGRGTPIPFDPPVRIVRSGAYAYLANPMQFATALLLVGWGVLLGSPWISLAGGMSVIFSIGLAAWSEGGDLSQRFGSDWSTYRSAVRNWRPRLRPWHPSLTGSEPDRLYVGEECVPCSQVGRWMTGRKPTGLRLYAAERHPARDLDRLTYESADGTYTEEGIAAFARALEHIHLGWALVGWAMRIPGLRWFIQLVADAVGLGPKQVRRQIPSSIHTH